MSGAQALRVQARLRSSQCCTRVAPLHTLPLHTCVPVPTDTQPRTHTRTLIGRTWTHAHSAHSDTRVCADARGWVLPVSMSRRVGFLLSFLPPPSSALCKDGRSFVGLLPSSWGLTSRSHWHAAPVWTGMDAASKVEIPLLCVKDACRTREQGEARLQGHSFLSRNRDVFPPAEEELLSSVPLLRRLSMRMRRDGGRYRGGECRMLPLMRICTVPG